ncbi:MAG TPA: hypothetical protein VMZ71_00310 [Gemmataceae bacterium]|nr:hypothetical protein [Gemmataceae bacterium]
MIPQPAKVRLGEAGFGNDSVDRRDAESQDADGKPILGFTLADYEEIGGNLIDQAV